MAHEAAKISVEEAISGVWLEEAAAALNHVLHGDLGKLDSELHLIWFIVFICQKIKIINK